VLIAVMVVIFGAALLLPFPGRHRTEPAETTAGPAPEEVAAAYLGDPADGKMWTARVRRWGMRTLPPDKLLPYNNGSAAVQQVGPVNWQKLAKVTQPINAAQVFALARQGLRPGTCPQAARRRPNHGGPLILATSSGTKPA
jgi:hypothetical protein